MYITICCTQQQKQILRYSAEFIKSLQPNAIHINHKTRKCLFKHNICKPKHSAPRSVVTSDLYNTIDSLAAVPSRSRCGVTPISEGARPYQPRCYNGVVSSISKECKRSSIVSTLTEDDIISSKCEISSIVFISSENDIISR